MPSHTHKEAATPEAPFHPQRPMASGRAACQPWTVARPCGHTCGASPHGVRCTVAKLPEGWLFHKADALLPARVGEGEVVS